MKLSSITCVPVLLAISLVGCADNTKPASDPSMEPSRVPPPGTPVVTSTNADAPVTTTTTPTNTAPPATWTTGTNATAPRTPSTTTAQPPAPASANAQPAPSTVADNTAMNTRDRSPSAVTPMDQGNSMADIKITQQIRQSVIGDSNMSFNAKNVKIITKDAHVVLRGTVNTISERQAIEAKAKAAAGVVDVSNLIDVKK